MHKLLTAALLLLGFALHAQVKGKVTSADGQPIPFVSVLIENTYNGTSANQDGQYEISIKNPGRYTLVFQSIGFKPKKVSFNAITLPHVLNVVLEDEAYELGEVIITNSEDPAYAIIRQAIAHRKENAEKTGRFEADFYSKGMVKAKNVPKRIMGMKVETEGALDSTGSGVVSLSETVSRIVFEYPDKLKETIIASKVSGRGSDYSYNSAREAQYNLYDNYITDYDFDTKLVSPIASGALAYYRYKLEGTYFDEDNNLINKIKILPRRDKEPVFEGYIYIADGSWAITAADLLVKGYRLRQPMLETMNIQQTFNYNATNGLWAKTLQTFSISAGALGIGVNVQYTHVYSNYVFYDAFEKETFTRGSFSFEKDHAKKDSAYWSQNRPVPLSDEEKLDYVKKDSMFAHTRTDAYKDSIQRSKNRFRPFDVLGGYTYNNPKTYIHSFKYDGVLDVPGYNTVQGWNFGTKLSLSIKGSKKFSLSPMSVHFNYGIAEDRFRAWGQLPLRFGKYTFTLSGGSKAEQFNPNEPILPLINSVATLFFKDNYMKLYDKAFARISHNRFLFKKLSLTGSVEYLRRRPLFNNTDYVLIKNDDVFTSNNPLDPFNYTSAPFEQHTLMKAAITGGIRFGGGNRYYSYGSGTRIEDSAPGVAFMYEKGFAGSEKQYEYDHIAVRAAFERTLGNKGDFGLNARAGKFFNADGIAFADFKHFNGNQTHIGTGDRYLNVFNMLPYYSRSTNDAYAELHAEHNFKGFIMNKVPLLDSLLWDLVLGYHALATPDSKPYHEFSAGFDNFGFGIARGIRIDYVWGFQGGETTHGIVFGLKF